MTFLFSPPLAMSSFFSFIHYQNSVEETSWQTSSSKSFKPSRPDESRGPVLSKALEMALGNTALVGLMQKKRGPDGKTLLALPTVTDVS